DTGIAVRRMALVLAASGTSLADLRDAIALVAAGAVTLIAADATGDRLAALSSRLSAADPEHAIIDAALDATGNSTLRVLGKLLTAISRETAAAGPVPDRRGPGGAELVKLLAAGDGAAARRWVRDLLAPPAAAGAPLTRSTDWLNLLV
ncbi:MAG TPA: hypothetical protein VHC18_20840, partial [Amycolatopsis sp.]|nr:hypothetical protein [Amycolatopsis sp.]